jgi:hypothetical protein
LFFDPKAFDLNGFDFKVLISMISCLFAQRSKHAYLKRHDILALVAQHVVNWRTRRVFGFVLPLSFVFKDFNEVMLLCAVQQARFLSEGHPGPDPKGGKVLRSYNTI